MGSINMGRVVIGGLVAGLLINVSEFLLNGVVLAQDLNDALKALNRPPVDGGMILWFVLLGFGIGFMAVWLYAAVRPRLGPGCARRSAPRLSCGASRICIPTSAPAFSACSRRVSSS